MNLCFRGLAYYYFKNGVEYTIDRVMIHFEGKKTDKAQAIAEIEDMSHLMAELAQFEIEEYNKKALKKKNDGVLLILDRITFADPSFYFIPAMLPIYIVNIKEGESDESEGSDEEQSEDSDDKNKKGKKSKKDKKEQSLKSKKKKRKDDDDDEEEEIDTKKSKKAKK